MKHFLKPFLLAGSITAGSVIGASAAILDFTDLTSYTSTGPVATGSIGSVGWTLTPSGGALNVNTTPDVGDSTGIPLALDTDGVGVIGGGTNDEVTDDDESLLLSFSRAIKVTAVHVLDLFFSDTVPDNKELALAYDDDDNTLIVTVTAGVPLGAANGGYKKSDPFGEYAVRNIRFEAGGAADDTTYDFALAAIEYASGDGQEPDPVPLPAGGLLLIGGLAALAAARRRM